MTPISTTRSSPPALNPEITPEMIYHLITLLQQLIEVSGKGQMAEQISVLIEELSVASKSMDRLAHALERGGIQAQRLERIEKSLNILTENLLDPEFT